MNWMARFLLKQKGIQPSNLGRWSWNGRLKGDVEVIWPYGIRETWGIRFAYLVRRRRTAEGSQHRDGSGILRRRRRLAPVALRLQFLLRRWWSLRNLLWGLVRLRDDDSDGTSSDLVFLLVWVDSRASGRHIYRARSRAESISQQNPTWNKEMSLLEISWSRFQLGKESLLHSCSWGKRKVRGSADVGWTRGGEKESSGTVVG